MKIVEWYKQRSKLTRFLVYYGTSPIWFPAVFVFLIITSPIVFLLGTGLKAWKDFK